MAICGPGWAENRQFGKFTFHHKDLPFKEPQDGLGWKGPCSKPLRWAGTPSTRAGCSEPSSLQTNDDALQDSSRTAKD